MLGEIQFQDVVRQRIERIAATVVSRNDLLLAFSLELAAPGVGLTEIPRKMQDLYESYLSNEARHGSSTGDGVPVDDHLPNIELF
jgi:methyl-accepting chemotaxis protein